MTEPVDRVWLAAGHESAHATCAVLVGAEIQWLTIDGRAECASTYRDAWGARRAVGWALIDVAGLAGEERMTGTPVSSPATSIDLTYFAGDLRLAQPRIGVWEEPIARRVFIKMAKQVLRRNEQTWLSLANRLADRQRMPGNDAMEVLHFGRQQWGWYVPEDWIGELLVLLRQNR